MEPKTYLAGEKQEPLLLPDLKPLLRNSYEPYDAGSLGEFDVHIMLQQFAGEKFAQELSPAWRGGGYWAFTIKGTPASTDPARALALVYLSRWSTPQAAQRFRDEYVSALKRRYKSVQAETGEATPIHWTTEEGPVLIEQRGNMVLDLESFDAANAEKIRTAVWNFELAPATQRADSSRTQ
jgi:hypothetical protein